MALPGILHILHQFFFHLKVTPEMLVAFFSGVGEIKYVRQSVHAESQERLLDFSSILLWIK